MSRSDTGKNRITIRPPASLRDALDFFVTEPWVKTHGYKSIMATPWKERGGNVLRLRHGNRDGNKFASMKNNYS